MKKKGILLITVMLVVSLVTACGQNSNRTSKENATSGSQGATKTLILGTSADFPPYEFHQMVDGKDQVVGFDIEIAKQIAADLGAELVIKDMAFESLLNELSSGRIDMIISGLSPTEKRKKQIDMSDIYYIAQQAIVVREADKDKYSTMESLEGLSIGVQSGSIQEEIANTIPNAKLTSLQKINDIIMQLKSNRVEAAIIEGPVARSFVQNVEGLVITEAQPEAEEEGYVVGVKKGNQELLDQVNKSLERLKADNKIEQFVQEASELAEKNED